MHGIFEGVHGIFEDMYGYVRYLFVCIYKHICVSLSIYIHINSVLRRLAGHQNPAPPARLFATSTAWNWGLLWASRLTSLWIRNRISKLNQNWWKVGLKANLCSASVLGLIFVRFFNFQRFIRPAHMLPNLMFSTVLPFTYSFSESKWKQWSLDRWCYIWICIVFNVFYAVFEHFVFCGTCNFACASILIFVHDRLQKWQSFISSSMLAWCRFVIFFLLSFFFFWGS